jgi:hypothetical protein
MRRDDVARVIDALQGTDDIQALEQLLQRIFAQWPGDSDVQLLASRIRRKIDESRQREGGTGG